MNYRFLSFAGYAFVWLKIAAPSDLLLDVVRLINELTYLLTYSASTMYDV